MIGHQAASPGAKVIIGVPNWTVGGACVLAETLLRGLNAAGRDTRVLLTQTQERAPGWPMAADNPPDLTFETLPAGDHDAWGLRWHALIRYLEEHAPCNYLMLGGCSEDAVAPRLSDRVRLVRIVQSDTDREYEHAAHLGHHWNAIVAMSDAIHFNLAYRLPHLAPRLLTIRNSVPALSRLPARGESGPLRIVFSGEAGGTPRPMADLRLIAYGVQATGAAIELTVIGNVPLRSQLKSEARPLVEGDWLRFVTSLSNEQRLAEFAEHDVFLAPQGSDGQSLALLEAMSRGCVPVVSDLVGHSLLLRDAVNGYCVPTGEVSQFVKRLTTLAEDPPRRQRMARAAFDTIVDGGYRVEDMLRSYLALFDRLEEMDQLHRFVRPRGWMKPPPRSIDGVHRLPGGYDSDLDSVNEQPLWPNPLPSSRATAPRVVVQPQGKAMPTRLQDHKLLVASSLEQISGVDVFSRHFVRAFRQRGFDARVVTVAAATDPIPVVLSDDVPSEAPPIPSYATWPVRWRTMIDYLEAQAPCIYIPNYDYEYAAIAPQLSDRVKIITVAHSDDPAYYELVTRIGLASDAIVGVSRAIVKQITALAPALGRRVHLVPYGVNLPNSCPTSAADPGSPLRLVYAGRLVSYQKRVLDLIAIAELLAKREIAFELTIIGDGSEREQLLRRGRQLLLSRRLRFLGPLPHDHVSEVLRESDILLMPSAFEGLSLVILEAMAVGVVPVVSDVRSGTSDLIAHEENGLVAPVGDTERFADHLCHLDRDRAELRRMSAAAHQTIRSGYRVEDMADRYTELMESAVAAPFIRPRGPIVPPDHLKPELRWQVQAIRRVRAKLRPVRAAWRLSQLD